MMQGNYLYVFLRVKRKKLLSLFLPDFQFLKICKMATIFGDDVTDLQQRHHQ